jgi:hypothetical protein
MIHAISKQRCGDSSDTLYKEEASSQYKFVDDEEPYMYLALSNIQEI